MEVRNTWLLHRDFLLAFDLKQEIRAFIIDKFLPVCEAQILRFMSADSLAIVRVRANMVPTKGGLTHGKSKNQSSGILPG